MSACITPNGKGGIPDDILDDLSARFVINMPKGERKDVTRVMFQIELAHWFYLDLLAKDRVGKTVLPRVNMTAFTRIMFQHIAHGNDFKYLKQLIVEDVITAFKDYKAHVPTYGAIILDPEMKYCIMVQGFGANGWGFPKGKINDHESPKNCAIREIREETGFDCEHLINDKDVIKKNFKGTEIVLYIIQAADKDYAFCAESRNEIKHIRWFDIDDLPDTFDQGKTSNSYYMAIPFIPDLRNWISSRRQQRNTSCNGVQILKPPNRAVVAPVVRGKQINCLPVRATGKHAFWTHLWENVTLDWQSIWNEVDCELALINA